MIKYFHRYAGPRALKDDCSHHSSKSHETTEKILLCFYDTDQVMKPLFNLLLCFQGTDQVKNTFKKNEHSHAHQHGPPEAPVEDVDDREEGDDVEDRAIVGQQGHQVM